MIFIVCNSTGEGGQEDLDLGVLRRLHLLLRLPRLRQHAHPLRAGGRGRAEQRGRGGGVPVACQRGFVRGPRLPGRTQLAALLIFLFLSVRVVNLTFLMKMDFKLLLLNSNLYIL